MAPMSTLVTIESLLLDLHTAEQNKTQKRHTVNSQVLLRENGVGPFQSKEEKSTLMDDKVTDAREKGNEMFRRSASGRVKEEYQETDSDSTVCLQLRRPDVQLLLEN